MTLIKGPFSIKVNEYPLNYVTDIVYSEDKLTIDMLLSDFEIANILLEKTSINRVYCIGCSSKEIGATYYTKKYTTSIYLQDNSVMMLKIIFDVRRAKVGEITE